MTTYVLDASALIRYADDGAGAERVERIILACVTEQAEVYISAVQWGEVAGNFRKRFGPVAEPGLLGRLLPSEAVVVPASSERAVRAAALSVDRKLAYADSFAIGLALETPNRILVTADYGFKAVEDLAKIEFLPPK